MSTRPKPSAVVFAKDVAGMARFYGHVAGMEEVHGDKGHVVLDGGHFQLVIHSIPAHIENRGQVRLSGIKGRG